MMAGDLAQSRQPFAVPDADTDDDDNTPKAITYQAQGTTDTSPQAQRKRVNRMLKLMQRKATLYELLDIKADAKDRDIIAAWKKTVGGIHPDKNKDKAAQECTQAANAAKDVLLNPEKQKVYDNFIRHNPPPKTETFDEDFAQGAFDNDDSSNDATREDDEEDSEEDDDEKNYPPPNKRVQKLHGSMTPWIKAFFENVEGAIDFVLLNTVDKINKKIEKENHDYRRAVLTMYQVPRQKLLFFQYAQRRVLMSSQTQQFTSTKVLEETLWLREHFAKTCQRGLYRWPTAWAQLLMEPLYRELEILGISREHALLKTNNNEDVEMEDVVEAETTHYQTTSRQIQPLRPGFTIIGDPILGYFPIQRQSKAGETTILGFKVFVKVDGANPIKIASGSEVGNAAALAYHSLPEQKKNNIRETAATYATMAPSDFVDIIGIACVPGSTSPSRLPTTYIWAKTLTNSDKPKIMTRTTFRQWMGTRLADKYIDAWFVTKGITPEWAVQGFPTDPANDSRYLRLTYPPPRQSSNYDLTPRIQTSGAQPPPSGEVGLSRKDGDIEELSRKFDQIVDMFVRGQEEAREDRNQLREVMNRLLPAPDSGA
ncbi:hypothetical protein CHU98_g3386 [Xylaria longipes]|nr:hypothetical protein CHU98_g3386 [Xylaria longipes]